MFRKALVITLALVAAGCMESTTRPASHAVVAPPRPSYTTYDFSDSLLGLSINANNHVSGTSWIPIRTSAISGSSGPYTYHWFQSYCYTDWTTCSDIYEIASGVGLDSIFVEYPGEMSAITYYVHVESATGTWGGSGKRTIINLANPAVETQSFSCDFPSNIYPIRDWDTYDLYGNPIAHYYRRNGCTGSREYKP